MTANSAEMVHCSAWITVRVKIQQEGRARDARSFINAAVQLAGPRRRAPMDAVQRIALLIRPHARQRASGLQTADAPRGFRRSAAARRDRSPASGRTFGIHQREMRFSRHAKTAMQAEHIAAFPAARPNLVIAAHQKRDWYSSTSSVSPRFNAISSNRSPVDCASAAASATSASRGSRSSSSSQGTGSAPEF